MNLDLDFPLFDEDQFMSDLIEWSKQLDSEWQVMINEVNNALALL
ncbi:hypothetical protein [Acinetobacter populi]|nr:hypothetical protein [Acinetobacter populi]